jgi:hypothetical protein
MPQPPAAPAPTLPPPLGKRWKRVSLDATDWRMYCDRLQDASAPEVEWQRAQRIADSLAQDVKLVLVAFAQAAALDDARYGNHWLRVGKSCFAGTEDTYIERYPLAWWRRSWVVDGFVRYPSSNPNRNEKELLALNYGTPWDLPHPRWPLVRKKRKKHADLVERFFDAHALAEIPQEYL